MNWRTIGAIIKKDMRVILRSKAVLLPIILVPLLIQVLLPAGLGVEISFMPQSASDMDDLVQMVRAMPLDLQMQLGDLSNKQLFLTLMLVYLFAPLYL